MPASQTQTTQTTPPPEQTRTTPLAPPTPKVSVLIPSLNVAPYIRECVQSVVNQTLRDIEIICIDANSTDGTLEVLREFAARDSRIKLIISEKKSYGYQMNLGLDAARGEYIGIVESDDYVDEWMFERLYSVTKKHDCDVLRSDIVSFTTQNGKHIKWQEPIVWDKWLYHKKFDFTGANSNLAGDSHDNFGYDKTYLLIWSWHMNPPSLFRREFLRKNQLRFNETPGASYQDTGFGVLSLLLADKIYFLPEAYYHYRRDNENSSVKSQGKVFCVCDEYEFIREFLQKRGLYETHFGAVLRHKFGTYKWNLGRLGDDLKLQFAQRFKAEFESIGTQRLKKAGFGRRELIQIYGLIHSPKDYAAYLCGSKSLLGRIKNILSYKIWWKLGFYTSNFFSKRAENERSGK